MSWINFILLILHLNIIIFGNDWCFTCQHLDSMWFQTMAVQLKKADLWISTYQILGFAPPLVLFYRTKTLSFRPPYHLFLKILSHCAVAQNHSVGRNCWCFPYSFVCWWYTGVDTFTYQRLDSLWFCTMSVQLEKVETWIPTDWILIFAQIDRKQSMNLRPPYHFFLKMLNHRESAQNLSVSLKSFTGLYFPTHCSCVGDIVCLFFFLNLPWCSILEMCSSWCFNVY